MSPAWTEPKPVEVTVTPSVAIEAVPSSSVAKTASVMVQEEYLPEPVPVREA